MLLELSERIAKNICELRRVSENYAHASVYSEDIESESGLNFEAVHIHSHNYYVFWFALGKSNRQLGVSFKNGVFYDVYCDSP